jgi:hypothetical protein
MDERLPLDKEMEQLCVKGPYIQPLHAGSFFEEEITAQLWYYIGPGHVPWVSIVLGHGNPSS